MARADAASASARPDSIKGLAQSIAKPAYRRLLTAEPALRRAVPALIIAFLLTIGVGAVVQVLDHRRQAISEAIYDIEMVAEFVSDKIRAPEVFTPPLHQNRSQPQIGRHRQRGKIFDGATNFS